MLADENSFIKFENIIQHFKNYSKLVIVEIDDHVTSAQLQTIRKQLREVKAELLKGKNTMLESAIRKLAHDIEFNNETASEWSSETLLDICKYLKGNIGLIFTNSTEIEELLELIGTFKFQKNVQVGQIAPHNIYITSGPSLKPIPIIAPLLKQMGISFRIIVGQVEVLRDSLLVQAGEKIEQVHLDCLETNMIPLITYGLRVLTYTDNSHIVWNGSYMKLMNLTSDPELSKLVKEAMDNIASIGLDLDVPNSASIPHSIYNGLMDICKIKVDLQTCYSIQQFTINQLPSEILILIGSYLNLKELYRLARCNRSLLSLFFNRRINTLQSNENSPFENTVNYLTCIVNEESVQFERVQREIWKPLVCFYFPNFIRNNLNIKNWLFVLRRRINYIKLKTPSINISNEQKKFSRIKDYEYNLINQCSSIYNCPLEFKSMQACKNSNRFCNICNKEVYLVESYEQAQSSQFINEGNCFAFLIDDDDELYEHELESSFFDLF